MSESICPSCGAPLFSDGVFCSRCGAPRSGALRSGAAPARPAAAGGAAAFGNQFEFSGGALGMFGRMILLGIGLFLIVPAPWAVCWFYNWLISKVEGRYGSRLSFHGTPGSVWVLTTLYGLLMIGSIGWNVWTETEGDPGPGAVLGFQLVNNLASVAIGYYFFRWTVGAMAMDGQRLTLTAGLGRYFGWMVLMMVSMFTIIGWAWVACGMYRWLAGTVAGAPGRITFTARGHQLLGRTLLMVLSSLPIVTIPWAVRGYLRWFVEKFRIVGAGEAA